jgi:DNA-binding transcriptional LysR family regulator
MAAPLDSWQLKAFVILARTGSYTVAARELSVTHSAVSHSMRKLENDTGCLLLTRALKTVTLTEAGEALLFYAEHILAEMEQARTALADLNKWGFRRLRLGADPTLCQYFLPAVLADLQKEFPRLLVHIELTGGADTSGWLETRRVDLILGEHPLRGHPTGFTGLFQDRVCLVANPSHPWATKGQAPRGELAKQPCVLPCPPSISRQLIVRHFAQEDIVLNATIEVDSVEATKEFVKKGLGIGFLPAWTAHQEFAEGSLVPLSAGRRHLTQTWGLLQPSGRPLDHVQNLFVKFCQKRGESFLQCQPVEAQIPEIER